MKLVCAWCKTELPASQNDGTERVSHGICVPCALKELPGHLHAQFLSNRTEADLDRVAVGRA